MNPLVSIITPTYNHEKFIADCIESVLAQTYPHWEIIIIDDASTDKTPYIVEQYAKKDNRIKFIRHEKNWGMYRLADTYNQALEISQGEYIAVLEGDDFWVRNKLATQLDYFEKHKGKILCHGLVYNIIEKRTKKVRVPKYIWNEEIRENKPISSILGAFLFGENPITSLTVMVRKSALLKIGGFQPQDDDLKLNLVDYPTWMRLSLYGEFGFISQVLGFYRRHFHNITSLYILSMWQDKIRYLSLFISQHKNEMLSLNPSLKDFIDNYGCNAYLEIARLKLLLNQKKIALGYLKCAYKKRKIIPRMERKIKLYILWFSGNFINIYKILYDLIRRK